MSEEKRQDFDWGCYDQTFLSKAGSRCIVSKWVRHSPGIDQL